MSPEPQQETRSQALAATLTRPPAGASLRAGGADELHAEHLRSAMTREYERGVGEGRAEALRHAGKALDAAVQRVDEARTNAAAELAGVATELSVEIARHLLRAEVEAGRYDLERTVRETLAAANVGRGTCTVHVHPSDLASLKETSFRNGTELAADPEVPRGNVHVSTKHGLLVHDLDEAVSAIAERIYEELR